MRNYLFLYSLLIILFSSCNSTQHDENKTNSPNEINQQPKQQSSKVSRSDTKDARHKNEASDFEKRLYDLLMKWKMAQNKGDFNRYSSFYSSSFTGIKRVGQDTYEYSYKDWLNDRKSMFNNPMIVGATDIKIQYKEEPYKIYFTQSWESGNYADVGPKVLKVKKENGALKIIYEEMLESYIQDFSGNVSNLTEHPNFYFRIGSHLLLDTTFSKSSKITTQRICPTDHADLPCYDLHFYSIANSIKETTKQRLLEKRAFLGNVQDSKLEEAKTSALQLKNEEIIDSLRGILAETSIIENSYSWPGGNEKFTKLTGVVQCETEKDQQVKNGQWGVISEKKPRVYTKDYADDSSYEMMFQSERSSYPSNELLVFTSSGNELYVSYNQTEECGTVYYDQIKLWKKSKDQYELIQELPDLPVLMMDIEHNGEVGMLFESELNTNPENLIEVNFPNFGINSEGDTVFLSCGC